MKAFILNYVLLILIGVAAVYSTTYKSLIGAGKHSWDLLLEQLLIIFFLLIIYLIVIVNRKFFYKLITYNINFFYYVLYIFLILVLTPLGTAVGGAKSSINLVFFNFQPIEIFKVVSILYIAKLLAEDTGKLSDKDFLYYRLALPFSSIVLIVLEHDTGGAVIMAALILVMLFLNNKRKKLIFKLLLWSFIIGIVGVVFLYVTGSERIGSWLDPFNHLENAGQNLIQSYIAISNGGLFGVGYLNSIQNTGFLFASSTDFVFSIIAEEFGIIGVTVVLILMFTFAYQIYSVGYQASRRYEYLVCSGVSFLLLIQTAVNVGGVTGVIPMTGVTLPFISRGLNSYLALNFAVLYIILIKLRTKEEKKEANKKIHKRSGRKNENKY